MYNMSKSIKNKISTKLCLKKYIHSQQHNMQATRRQITARIEIPVVIQASSMKDTHRCAHETRADKQWTAHIVYIHATHPNHRTQYTISMYHIIGS